MNTFHLSANLVERLGWVLVHSAWQFALVALLAVAIVRAMRQYSAATRYGVLVVAMAVSVAAPVVTWLLMPSDVAANRNRVAFAALDSPDATDRRTRGIEFASDPTIERDGETEFSTLVPGSLGDASTEWPEVSPQTTANVPSQPSLSERARLIVQPWLGWIVIVWSLGVVLCSARPLLSWYTVRRLRRVGVSPVPAAVATMLRQTSERLRLRQTVQILQSTLTQVPIVIGYLRPVILLPVSVIAGIPTSQLEAILAHELAHVRRHDFLVNLLQTLIETLFFYHPAVWWLSHRIRIERENCCDDLAVSVLGNRVEYGRALLAIEELRGKATALALGARGGSLLDRVQRLFRRDPSERTVGSIWIVGVGLLAILIITVGVWSSTRADDEGIAPGATATLDPPQLADAGIIAERFRVALKRQALHFLDQPRIEALQSELRDDVARSSKTSLAEAEREALMVGIDGFVAEHFRADEGDYVYLRFRDAFETLKWQLRIAMSRAPLTDTELARREHQRQWMVNAIKALPERPRFQVTHKVQIEKLNRLLSDPLNPFFTTPLSEAEFVRFQKEFEEDVARAGAGKSLSFAASWLTRAAVETRIESVLREWPVKNLGHQRTNTRWSLIVTPSVGNTTLHLEDVNSNVRDVYADVMQNKFVAGDAPADLAEREAWLLKQPNGDLCFDARLDSLVGVRGAKLAVLEAPNWYEADCVSLAELRQLIDKHGQASLPLSHFAEPRSPDEPVRRPKNPRPSLVVQTGSGDISVIRLGDVDPLIIMPRRRPLSPNPPLHPGDEPEQGGEARITSFATLPKTVTTESDASLDVAAEIPDSEYTRPTAKDQEATAMIPAEAWGESVAGLRLAVVLHSPPIDKEERLCYDIVVENVSDHDIRFSAEVGIDTWHFFFRSKLVDADGKQVEQQRGFQTFLGHRLIRIWLKPRERYVISSWATKWLKLDDEGKPLGRPDEYRGYSYFSVKPGRYSLSAAMELGSGMNSTDPVTKKRTVLSPAKGEWSGKLQTGAVPVALFTEPVPADEAAAKHPPIELRRAVASERQELLRSLRDKHTHPPIELRIAVSNADRDADGVAWFPITITAQSEPVPAGESGANLPIEEKLNDRWRGLLWDKPERALLAGGTWRVEKCDVVRSAQSTDLAPHFDVRITVNAAGGESLRRLTRSHLNERLAIVVDGTIIATPVVNEEFGEEFVITGNFTKETAEQLAAAIRKPDQRKTAVVFLRFAKAESALAALNTTVRL